MPFNYSGHPVIVLRAVRRPPQFGCTVFQLMPSSVVDSATFPADVFEQQTTVKYDLNSSWCGY